jgi:hypothetical protein
LERVLGLEAEFFQDPNLYKYAFNDPINKIDDNGLWVWHVVGAGLGAALDLGAQLATNGGNLSEVSWTSVGVSAASGALGAGLGANVARLTGSTIARAGLNAVGSAAIGAGGQIVKNAANDCEDNLFEGTGRAALFNGSLGGAGSLTGTGFSNIYNSTSRALARRSAPQGSRLLSSSGTLRAYSANGTTPGTAGGNALGSVISNSSSLFDSESRNGGCD